MTQMIKCDAESCTKLVNGECILDEISLDYSTQCEQYEEADED